MSAEKEPEDWTDVLPPPPAPPVPFDADLRAYPRGTPDITWLIESEDWTTATDAERVASLALWVAAWKQIPAGSLPNNDEFLRRLSARDLDWKQVRYRALCGWYLCNDGRMYHAKLSDLVLEVWREVSSTERDKAAHARLMRKRRTAEREKRLEAQKRAAHPEDSECNDREASREASRDAHVTPHTDNGEHGTESVRPHVRPHRVEGGGETDSVRPHVRPHSDNGERETVGTRHGNAENRQNSAENDAITENSIDSTFPAGYTRLARAATKKESGSEAEGLSEGTISVFPSSISSEKKSVSLLSPLRDLSEAPKEEVPCTRVREALSQSQPSQPAVVGTEAENPSHNSTAGSVPNLGRDDRLTDDSHSGSTPDVGAEPDGGPKKPIPHLRWTERRWHLWNRYLGDDPDTGTERVEIESSSATKRWYLGQASLENQALLEVVLRQLGEILGITDPHWKTDWSVLVSWFDEGAVWKHDIRPILPGALERGRKANKPGRGPRWVPDSLSYFTPAIREARAERLKERRRFWA
jgi:hypothetical protein